MIIDTTMFNEDFQTLEIRIKELWDVVDMFVICESRYTFSGDPKPLHLSNNLDVFKKYEEKMKVIVENQKHLTRIPMIREIHQRKRITKFIKSLNLTQNDLIIYSDCDEIPRAEVIEKLKNLPTTQEDLNTILSCDWFVDVGYCHGDLTFENTIVSDNGVYLIDFLDSFVNSPVIDHSKILQDAFCYWSFGDGYVPVKKLLNVCEMFDNKQNYAMLLIHLIRILPYANAKKKEIILCMMDKVRQKINQF